LIDDEEFCEQVLKDVQEACKKGGIEKFEMPQRIKIVTEPWIPESGLVTDALKLKRKAIEQKYREEIDDLYDDRPKNKSSKRPKKSRPGSEQQSTDVITKKIE
jgi:long-subunit acyl-CoA synthetase (AMP-forming)